MPGRWYNDGQERAYPGNWTSLDVRCILLDDTYTFDPTHSTVADLTGELTDASYGRVTLANKAATWVEDDAPSGEGHWELDADEPVFSSLGGTQDVQHAVLFIHVDATDANNLLISNHQQAAGATAATNGNDFTVRWDDGHALQVRDEATIA